MISTHHVAPISDIRILAGALKVPAGFSVGADSQQVGGICYYVIRNRDDAAVLARVSEAEDEVMPMREMAKALHAACDAERAGPAAWEAAEPGPEDYRRERQKRGTQVQVAAALGIDRGTIIRREQDKLPITREAWLALTSLPVAPRPRE